MSRISKTHWCFGVIRPMEESKYLLPCEWYGYYSRIRYLQAGWIKKEKKVPGKEVRLRCEYLALKALRWGNVFAQVVEFDEAPSVELKLTKCFGYVLEDYKRRWILLMPGIASS
jgi:hypothetical protein